MNPPNPAAYVVDHDAARRERVLSALGGQVPARGFASVDELLALLAETGTADGGVILPADTDALAGAHVALGAQLPLLVLLDGSETDDAATWLARGASDVLLAPLDARPWPCLAAGLRDPAGLTLEAGQATFEALAREHSQDGSAKQGGDLGWANPGRYVPEFEQALSTLRPGEISEPLVSRFGVHLIQLVDRREAKLNQREQRDMLRDAVREKKLEEAYATWAQELRGRAYVEYREPPQ